MDKEIVLPDLAMRVFAGRSIKYGLVAVERSFQLLLPPSRISTTLCASSWRLAPAVGAENQDGDRTPKTSVHGA